MAGEDIDLKLIIKALLDSKGFDEAQTAMKGLAASANATKPATEGLTDKQKGLAQQLGGTRGAAADMTRVLLMNIGVTGAAGEAAKAAGLSMTALGGAVSPVHLAAVGLVAAAALLIPKLIEWANSSKDTEKATKDLKESIVGMLPELENYIRAVPNATAELKALFEVSRGEALRKQKQEIADLTDQSASHRKEIDRLRAGTDTYTISVRGQIETHRLSADSIAARNKKLAEEEDALAAVDAKLNALLAAEDEGMLVSGQIRASIDAEKEKRDKLTKAIADQRREEERLKKLREDDLKNAAKLRSDEAKAETEKRKQHEKDIERATERILQIGRQKGAYLEEAKAAIQSSKDKRAADAAHLQSQVGYYTSFFGNNKAVRTAQAIADTYAGATRALAEFPAPYSYAVAAAIVAAGLANVANIRKQEIGFDDPFNDLLAEKMGRKSAADFVRHFGIGFQGGMGGGGTTNHYNTSSTTINRGVTLQGGLHSHSIVGSSATNELKQLERKLINIRRLEGRTTVGRR